jgi:hypothetical protein
MGLFNTEEPDEVIVRDKPFRCTACGNGLFWRRRAQLNTALASFFSLDWANRSAKCAVCSECRYVHWFLEE